MLAALVLVDEVVAPVGHDLLDSSGRRTQVRAQRPRAPPACRWRRRPDVGLVPGPPTDQLAAAPATPGRPDRRAPLTARRDRRRTGRRRTESTSFAPTNRRSPADEIATDCQWPQGRAAHRPTRPGARGTVGCDGTRRPTTPRDRPSCRASDVPCRPGSREGTRAPGGASRTARRCCPGCRPVRGSASRGVAIETHPLAHGTAALVIDPWRVATPTSLTVTASATWPPNRIG
jgi:hypothetical protein